MNIGFCCATPYHLLLALRLATHEFKKDDKYLVIFEHFAGAKEVILKCKKLGVFKQVSSVDNLHQSQWKRRYHIFKLYDGLNDICSQIKFDKFIFFLLDPLTVSLAIKKITRKNPCCEICLGEDGLGAYIEPEIYKYGLSRGKTKFWMKVTHRFQYLNAFKYHYLIRPEMISTKDTLIPRKITPLDFSDFEFRNVVENIWGKQNLLKGDILFLQQPFEEKVNRIENSIIQELYDCCNRKSILNIKLHPRTQPLGIFKNKQHLIDQNLMYELVSNELSKYKLIIGINSSALFTPFMLWGNVTSIMLLYKICKPKMDNENFENFLLKFTKIYTEYGGKITVPNNMDEVKKQITAIC